MRTLFALVLAAGCLAACAGVQPDRQREQMAELRRQVVAEKQDCDNLYPRDAGGPQMFSHRARCLNDVETRLVRPVAPFPDLLDQRLAARKALASELDAGRISEAEANARLAAQNSAIEERRRGEHTGSIPADATATARLTQQQAMLRATCTEVDAKVSCF
jgi:hypothetical protein